MIRITPITVNMTSAMMIGDVAPGGVGDGHAADAGQPEDLLYEDGAAEQADELHAEHGQRGGRGVADDVDEDDQQ
ncbi:hypothetical protein GCM10020219_000910 [Nonomuraea dietziae]